MTKISDFSTLAGAGVDLAADALPIIDDSETGVARNKRILLAQLKLALGVSDAPDLSGYATTAQVDAAIAALIASAPGALNTLDELAQAMGDDANFAATVTNALALKAPLASPALTGTPTAPTASGGTDSTQIATTAFVQAAVGGTATPGTHAPQAWAPNFTGAADVYIPATVAMTIAQGNAAIGTGTLGFAKSTSAAPGTFTSTTLPATLEAGAWLRVTASAVTGFVATHLVRTA